jgi:hypothetical protein
MAHIDLTGEAWDYLTGRGNEAAETDRVLTEAERFPSTRAYPVRAATWFGLTTGYLTPTGRYRIPRKFLA